MIVYRIMNSKMLKIIAGGNHYEVKLSELWIVLRDDLGEIFSRGQQGG